MTDVAEAAEITKVADAPMMLQARTQVGGPVAGRLHVAFRNGGAWGERGIAQ